MTGLALIHYKDFDQSLSKLSRGGGERKRIADKVYSAIQKHVLGHGNLADLPITKNGETRIQHCTKYDLGNGYRLVTIQLKKYIALCFIGNHDSCDQWLDRNSGLTFTIDSDGTLGADYKSNSSEGVNIVRAPKPNTGQLLTLLPESYQAKLLANVPPLISIKVSQLQGFVLPDEIDRLCNEIDDLQTKSFVRDTLLLLSNDDLHSAKKRIELEYKQSIELEDADENQILNIKDGDQVRRLIIGSQEYENWINRFSKEAEYYDWLLFMHPEQEALVHEHFTGSAMLSGVSGSGKTCIAVKRALKLSNDNTDNKVLLVTLNRSLAHLIKMMLIQATIDKEEINNIKVCSFFELCQELLIEYEPENKRIYSDVSWKLEEHIDEIFREYYRCWSNNKSAEILLPIHASLTAKGLSAEDYLREEFDWIRSAIPKSDRSKYIRIDREGRKYPILEHRRQLILKGLDSWEKKMTAIGVIDYLGLTTQLSNHLDKISSRYEHIIIDEAQDFGTTELSIIKNLSIPGENDIFMCGDIAQHVLPKHRSLKIAGINTQSRQRTITKNYRNTRQILKAAYSVLEQNLDEEQFNSHDLEILDPDFANRSSNEPLVLEASNLTKEFAYAFFLVEHHIEVNPNHTCCIAVAGFSQREIEQYGALRDIPVLQGLHSPEKHPLVLSDLEQTKGYEFNLMIILNCCDKVLPPTNMPEEESFREGCKLYVAMTRARDELYLSFHGEPSKWLSRDNSDLFFDKWEDVCEFKKCHLHTPPIHLEEIEASEKRTLLQLSGREFIYTSNALGLSKGALNKIDELVDGVGMTRNGNMIRWRNVGAMLTDLERSPRAKQLFGPKIQEEIRSKLSELVTLAIT
ncbi:hypothetical protein WH95_06275 [Kiloniella litopenaei]|uniref:DNA 3'-5' helicase n=1 Tax=Kiloniella litopenaei TaxID=1549748 RepID=A0A0M2R7V8_9PROT|nr:UvrD-helicase domain-containing protein [Kiloniella litopenaei]KKJ78007.1 hypothetical protein WH95_06275 [Kiloniella litopenaei]